MTAWVRAISSLFLKRNEWELALPDGRNHEKNTVRACDYSDSDSRHNTQDQETSMSKRVNWEEFHRKQDAKFNKSHVGTEIDRICQIASLGEFEASIRKVKRPLIQCEIEALRIRGRKLGSDIWS